MKKFIVLLFLLTPFSAFAGVDTDRICGDDSKFWKISENITVSYPNEVATVWTTIWKIFYKTAPNNNTIVPEWYVALYYVVNIGDGQSNKRAELYTYNCSTKTPKLLLTITLDSQTEDYYNLDFVGNRSLAIVWRASGYSLGPTATIIGYDYYANKKLFSYKNKYKLFNEGTIEWFVSWKWAWYIYFVDEQYASEIIDEKVYKIDKKTFKVTKL